MAKFDVVSLGEFLIDFTQNGVGVLGNPLFEANPGGAVANVLAMLRKLDKTCALICKVGADRFGDQLEQTAVNAGIDVRALRRDPVVPTTLAIVHTKPNGDRDFSFYRSPGADVNLSVDELDMDMIRNCRIFHFGTLSLTDEPCRTATQTAVAAAKEAGALLSFDPNLRPPLWKSAEEAKKQIIWGLERCDVLKISDNEVEFMTGEKDLVKGAAILRKQYPNIRLLNVTAGAEGSCAYYGDLRVEEPACKRGGTIETTGAGDTFCACVLSFLLEHGLDHLGEAELSQMLRFANTAAYIVTTKRGAICAMPTRAQVEELL